MDNEILLFLKKHLSTITLIVLPLICFIYSKIKNRNHSFSDAKICFVVGIIFVVLGLFLASMVLRPDSVVGLLALKDLHNVGRFIPIGYAFIVLSIMLLIDSTIARLFERFEKRKIS